MNYLAHAVLSFDNNAVLVGQFIADDVKGNRWMNYQDEIKKGILLHRFIDDYTDNHPGVLLLKKQLYPSLGKFAGVALDVLFDHCLSLRWDNHLASNRSESITGFYEVLRSHQSHLSEKRLFILEKMIEHDWMNMYADREGTDTILRQMSRRITFDNPLDSAWVVFERHEQGIISTFDTFFPNYFRPLRPNMILLRPNHKKRYFKRLISTPIMKSCLFKHGLTLLMLVALHMAAGAATIMLEGRYQQRNIFVINAASTDGIGYCIYEVLVNGLLTTDEINTQAFEIDLTIYGLKKWRSR